MKTKKMYSYAVVTLGSRDGYSMTVCDNPSMDTGEPLMLGDRWLLVESFDLLLPDPEAVARVGMEACDAEDEKIEADMILKRAAIKDARARYMSLPAPESSE